jgi:hypothetical protein
MLAKPRHSFTFPLYPSVITATISPQPLVLHFLDRLSLYLAWQHRSSGVTSSPRRDGIFDSMCEYWAMALVSGRQHSAAFEFEEFDLSGMIPYCIVDRLQERLL